MFKLLALSCIVIFVACPICVVAFDARIAALWNSMNKNPVDGYIDAVEVQTFFAAMKTNPADPNGLNVDDFTRGWKVDTADTTTTCFFFFNHWDRNKNFFLDTTDLGTLFHEIDLSKDNRWDYLSEFYPYMLDLYNRAPKSHFEFLL